jgi:hypothetical protein
MWQHSFQKIENSLKVGEVHMTKSGEQSVQAKYGDEITESHSHN